MIMKTICGTLAFNALLAGAALANTQPVVSNVVAVQRPHTALVDVTFDLADADGDLLFVSLWYSLNNGVSWDNECISTAGDVGEGIVQGQGLSVTWDAGADGVDVVNSTFRIRVYADDGGSQTYWAEDFELGCPAGWTLGGDWECGAPTSGPGAPFDGSNCLGTVLAGNYNNNNAFASSTATSPAIDLSAAASAVLTFRGWVDTEGSVYDGFNLKISTDGGTNFSLLNVVDPPYDLTINGQPAWGGLQATLGWQEFSADLSAYSGQTVHLQLAFRSDGSIVHPGVYVDTFHVGD